MDFASDALADGQKIRTFNVIDAASARATARALSSFER
jgi:hypothetical protein